MHRFIQSVFNRDGYGLAERTSVSHPWGRCSIPLSCFFFFPSSFLQFVFFSFICFALFYLQHLPQYLFSLNYFPLHDTQLNRMNFSFSNSCALVNQVADLGSWAVALFLDFKFLYAPWNLLKAVHILPFIFTPTDCHFFKLHRVNALLHSLHKIAVGIWNYPSHVPECRAELLQFHHGWKLVIPQLSPYEWKRPSPWGSHKKSRTDMSGDLEGQCMSPKREMSQPGNCCRNLFMLILAVWAVAPSCWSHAVSRRSIHLNSSTRKVLSK